MTVAILALFGAACLIGLFVVPFWAESLFEVGSEGHGRRLTRLGSGTVAKLKKPLESVGHIIRRQQPTVGRAFTDSLARASLIMRSAVPGEGRPATDPEAVPRDVRPVAPASPLIGRRLQAIEENLAAGRFAAAAALARAVECEAEFLQAIARLSPGCRHLLEVLLAGLRDENTGLKADLVARVRRHVERDLQECGDRLARTQEQRRDGPVDHRVERQSGLDPYRETTLSRKRSASSG